MLQAANTNLSNPLVTNKHTIVCVKIYYFLLQTKLVS